MTDERTLLSTHEVGVGSVVYSPAHRLVISGGWDDTLHIHNLDPSTQQGKPLTPATVKLPSDVIRMALSPTKLVVTLHARNVHVYDLSALALLSSQAAQPPPNQITIAPWQERESALKFLTRSISTMPSDDGYAIGSIEGRVAVEWFDPSPEIQNRKYAFKCHREVIPATSDVEGYSHETNGVDEDGDQQMMDMVYPVHALSFNPTNNTFASGGGDGVVCLWDAIAKRRLRQFPKQATGIGALAWNLDGRYLAVGICPGPVDGYDQDPNWPGEGPFEIWVREIRSEKKGGGAH